MPAEISAQNKKGGRGNKKDVEVDKVGGDQLKSTTKDPNIVPTKNGTFWAAGLTQLLTGHLSVTVRYWGDLPPPAIIVSWSSVPSFMR